jgi:hypothetical protein
VPKEMVWLYIKRLDTVIGRLLELGCADRHLLFLLLLGGLFVLVVFFFLLGVTSGVQELCYWFLCLVSSSPWCTTVLIEYPSNHVYRRCI